MADCTVYLCYPLCSEKMVNRKLLGDLEDGFYIDHVKECKLELNISNKRIFMLINKQTQLKQLVYQFNTLLLKIAVPYSLLEKQF